MRRFFIVATFLLAPSLAFAAGFAKDVIFLSQSSVTEGDTVSIYATVTNSDPTAFNGIMKFYDETGTIGTVSVSLKPDQAALISTSWAPKAGAHNVTAALETSAGDKILSSETTQFTIAPKPQAQQVPPADAAGSDNLIAQAQTAPVEPSDNIQQSISSLSPAVAKDSKPIFTTLDNARVSAAKSLDSAIGWSKEQMAIKPTNPTFAHTFWVALVMFSLYILTVLRFLIAYAGVFYPLFGIAFLYMLWRLFRRFRRRRY